MAMRMILDNNQDMIAPNKTHFVIFIPNDSLWMNVSTFPCCMVWLPKEIQDLFVNRLNFNKHFQGYDAVEGIGQDYRIVNIV